MKKKLKSNSPSNAAACSPASTPEMDAAAYEATTRTVGKWIVPLAKARKVELERNAYRRAHTSGECLKCLLNGWDPESKGPCPSYPECGRSFPENAERIHGGAGDGKPRDASTPLDDASC